MMLDSLPPVLAATALLQLQRVSVRERERVLVVASFGSSVALAAGERRRRRGRSSAVLVGIVALSSSCELVAPPAGSVHIITMIVEKKIIVV